MVNMNMIVNKSDLVGYEAVDRTEAKRKALAKIVAAWESKQAKNAKRFGGLGFLAVSLAACNSSDDTATTTTTTTTEAVTPTVTAHTADLAATADIITSAFTSANDSIAATDTTLGAGDVLVDTSTTDSDTLTVTMTGATAAAPSTVTGIENIVYNYGSIVTANDSTINLNNIIGAHATINHTGNALVAPGSTTVNGVGPNMTVTMGTNVADASVVAIANSASGVTLNAGASELTVNMGTGVAGLTINGGTSGAMTVNMDQGNAGASAGANINSNTTITTGTGLGAITVANNSATGTNITTGYTGADTGGQTISITDISTSAVTLTVGKTGTAASATTVNLDAAGTTSTTDAAVISAPGIITLETASAAANQQVELLTLSGNGAAATYNLDADSLPLSTTFTGDQSVTFKMTNAQALGHTTGITDSTTAGTTTVQVTGSATAADYSLLTPDVLEFQTDVGGAVAITVRDGQTIALTTEADHSGAFTLDINDRATADTSTGTATINVGTVVTGDITINGAGDYAATVGLNFTAANTDFVVIGGTTATLDASGAVAVTFTNTTTGVALDASDMTGAVTATLTDNLKSITGGSGNDIINGNDTPVASSVVDGGAGNDEYIVPNAADNTNITFSNIEVLDITAAEGNVLFKASQLSGKSYIIDNNDANDILAINGAGAATLVDASTINLSGLTFNSSAKTLIDVTAADPATFLSSQAFTITGSGNIDTINGSANADTLSGGAGNDIISGNAGNDIINGDAGADTLNGNAGDDTINGGAGVDPITGGTGADTITSGAGADTMTVAAGDASAGTAAGAASTVGFDTITDFTVGTSGDAIVYAASTTETNATATTGNAAIASGIATFHADDDTLAEKIVAVNAAIDAAAGSGNGDAAAFQHGSDAYLFIYDGTTALATTDSLIKLTGIDLTSTASDALDTTTTTNGFMLV